MIFFLLGIRETAYASSKELTYMCSTSKYGSFQSVKLIIENAIIILGHVHVLRCHLDPPYQRLNRIIHMNISCDKIFLFVLNLLTLHLTIYFLKKNIGHKNKNFF